VRLHGRGWKDRSRHGGIRHLLYAPPPIPVLPEWSPAKVFGGYGAPLDVRKAAQAGVPAVHHHTAECHQHGCAWRHPNRKMGYSPHCALNNRNYPLGLIIVRFDNEKLRASTYSRTYETVHSSTWSGSSHL